MKDYAQMTARLLYLCILATALSGNASEIKRLYVEPFTTKSASEKLHSEVIAELHKLGSVSIVTKEAEADAILGGGGEIWIKGYRSLNPRSGRETANGTPVYDGFLSVELRDTKGETLWSDLVTPGAGAEDVPKDLAKRIAKHLAEALPNVEAAGATGVPPQPSTVLQGAGATFPYPVYAKWITNYRRANPSVEINYEPVGSEAGIRKLLAGEVDFGASDSPQAIRDLAPGEQDQFLFFPSVVGAVVPIVNIPGISSDIALTPQALADIYLGKITKWNDPLLKKANRGVHLPDLDIVVVHRADGSGTSYAWTDYLSKTSSAWKTQVGAGLTPQWPTGRAAVGNDGVAKLVKEMGGSIGYVEFIYALQNHMSFAKVQNRNGEFVGASLESMAIAARSQVEVHDDFKASLADAPGEGAYPIASFTWLVIPAHVASDGKREALDGFLRWMLGPGQLQAAALGYLALPKDVVGREEVAIVRIH